MMLLFALFFIFFARCANRSVCNVSSRCLARLEAVQTRAVFALPPRDSFKKKVSFESLKGMWTFFPLGPGGVVSATMQPPRQERLWLIFLASSSVCPAAPVF